jgi:N-acetylneuraminate synthase
MNTIESITKAIAIFKKHNVAYALLHTTNLYPTPNHLVRLGALEEMQQAFPNTIVGLSDHTISNHACLGAVALGASILERHFTDHMDRPGPDIICSMDEQACKDLIEGSAIMQKQRGGNKGPSAEEQVTIDFAFATICTIKPINKGEQLTLDNIWVKRPGKGGILAESFPEVIGKIAASDIDFDVQLNWTDIEN